MIGTTLGTFMCGAQSSHLGRKKTMMITQGVAFIGSLCILLASNNIALFYSGNFIAGYTNGVFLGVTPIYTSEINQPHIRKFTGSFLALLFFLGFSMIYLVGGMTSWKIAASIQTVWPCIVFILLFVCPESPTWLMIKGRKDIATETLIRLRGDTEVAKQEILRIETNLDKQKMGKSQNPQSSYIKTQLKVMTKGTFIRPCLVLSTLWAIGWQWTGGIVLELYTVDILEKFEIPIDPYLASTAIGCYQLIAGICSIFISSSLPRRKYYIGSGIGVVFGAFLLALSVHLRKYDFFVTILNENVVVRWIPVIALMIFFAGYSTGYVTVCFMLLGELLPSNGRESGSFIVVQLNNVSSIVLIKFVPDLIESLGLDGMFWLFSGIGLFSTIFAYICVPETFGKSLEDIEEHYREICYHNRLNSFNIDSSKNSHISTVNANLSYQSD